MPRQSINVSSSGLSTLVAAVPGKSIIVLRYKIVAAGDVNISFESSGGRVIDGPCSHQSGGGVMAPFDRDGHFQTDTGEGLQIYLDAAVQVGGSLTYGLI